MELCLCERYYCIVLLCSAFLFAASENVKDNRAEYLHEWRLGAPQFHHSIDAPLSSSRFQSNSAFEEFARPDIARRFSDMRRKRSTLTEENGADISPHGSPLDTELNTILDERPHRIFYNNKKKIDKMKQLDTVALKDGSNATSRDGDERIIEAMPKKNELRSVDNRNVIDIEGTAPPDMGPPAALQGHDLLNDHVNLSDESLETPLTSDDMVVGEDVIMRTIVDTNGVSPLLDHTYGGTQTTAQTTPGSPPTPRLSWLAEFLCSGRGPGWLALNIILLVLIVFVALLSLFRLLALRSCTSLLSRTLYLFVMILCFTAAAFTAVHLIHLCFGGKEGLPLLLTLVLTHTPVPCLTVALCLILHSILDSAREPWPMSCAVLSRVSIVLVLASVAGDVAVSLLHSTALLITCRVTLTAVAILPVLMYLLKYCRVREVHAALRREIQGELKLMVPPSKDSVAYEQRCAQYLLRDILCKWATVLLIACIVTIVLWGCNLSLSVFFAVSRVPAWLWWFCHTTNVLFQIILIVLLIVSCALTVDGRYPTLWHKVFSVPKDLLNPPTSGTPNGKRNFVYERVSYSSGPESSQRTSSSQNETDDSDTRVPVSLNPQSTPPVRPRVTLQRSATFNCAPRMPFIYGYHPGYPHLLPPYYQRAGSFAQIHQHQAMPPSMLVNEAGFVRFNMPIQNFAFPQAMQPHNPGEVVKNNEGVILAAGDPNLFQPNVDIEYNSLRRFPRRHASRQVHNIPEDQGTSSKFNPPEIRMIAPSSAMVEQMDPTTYGVGSAPVSPYHALPFLPTYTPSIIHAPAMTSFHPTGSPSNSASSEMKSYQSPPALPSRAGSFRNHYAPQASPASSPLSSPYQPLPVGSASYPVSQSFQRSPSSQPQSPVSPYHVLPPSKQRSSRPTSPSIHSLAFPPPPPVPDNSPTRSEDQSKLRNDAVLRLNVSDHPESPFKSHSGLGHDLFKTSPSYNVAQASTRRNPNHQNSKPPNAAELQLHEEKSIENTVRDILTSGDRPVIRPRKQQHSLGRLPRHNQSFRRDDPQNIYANGSSANGFGAPPTHIAMDTISNAASTSVTDDEVPSDQIRNSVPSLKRNHSTAGCYYPKDRKDSFCQTDDEGNKYSSFRLSQLRTKPADWYGTWAGRRKSKNGAYSIDSEKKSSAEVPSLEGRDSEKRLSTSRASSIISIYNKLKSRKEKLPKDDSSESTEKDDRDDAEMSQASTFDDTPTPSEKTDDVSIATEEDKDLENPLTDVLDEIKEKTQDDADWTMDILSSSSVLSDFYKLKSDRPPPLPELSELDG